MPKSDKAVTVLVVEDEFLIRTDIADQLRESGFAVFEASYADEAIKRQFGELPSVTLAKTLGTNQRPAARLH